MAKKGKAIPKQHVTKRRLARWQQERRKRRIYTAAGILIIALIAIIIVYGFYTTSISMAGQWVTTVGGTRYVGTDYADSLHLCQLGFYGSTGDPKEAPILLLERDELVRQSTAEMGISVNDSEVMDEIRSLIETENESMTDEEFEQAYQQILEAMELTDEVFTEVMENAILQKKLYEHLLEDVPEVGESVNHVYLESLLVTNQSVLSTVLERLDSGEDLADFHGDSDSPGNYSYTDIGWTPRGVLAVEMEEIAFSLEVGEISDPAQSGDVYYILQVTGKEDRPLDEAMREQLEYNVLPRWIMDESEEKVERNEDLNLEKMYEWALDRIGGVSSTPIVPQ
jgi:foldase protein PrsA